MTIDFSKGIDYWVDAFNRLLTLVEDLFESCFGIKLFAEDETAAQATGD